MSHVDFFADELARIPVHGLRTIIEGVPTAWWNYGPRAGPIGLVMIHGFRGDHHGLEPFVAKLGDARRIVVPDLPGFGDSGVSTLNESNLTLIDGYAQWLQDFLTAVGADKNTVILGHSFGSIVVAASFARGLNQDGCILVNPIAANALTGPRGILTRLAVWYYKTSAALPERLGQRLLRNRAIVRIMSATMAKTSDRQLRRWIHGQHDSYFSSFASRESVLRAFQASVAHDVSEFSSTLPEGTLLIAADRDDITTVPRQRELAEKIPGSTLEIIPNVGHLVHYEAPAQAAQAIRRYLEERDQSK